MFFQTTRPIRIGSKDFLGKIAGNSPLGNAVFLLKSISNFGTVENKNSLIEINLSESGLPKCILVRPLVKAVRPEGAKPENVIFFCC